MAVASYKGRNIVIHYDVARCIHAAECVRGAPDVFDPNSRPWINPDGSDADYVAAIIARCPTGALSATRPDGTPLELPCERNVAAIQPRGPIYLRARVSMAVPGHATLVEYDRIALCRCGRSRNKPFCDGSHTKAGFDDAGTIAKCPESIIGEPAGGVVQVTPKPNGPLMIEGTVEFRAADGISFVAEKVWLCRCGQSRNKPFCDGSHKTNGFVG